jgi:hypothetical protein
MSAAPTNPALTPPPTAPASTSSSIFAGFEAILYILFFLLLLLGPAVSAAKLSYDKYGSFLWAALDFFFPVFYIPYYAFFLNTPTSSTFGGRARRR